MLTNKQLQLIRFYASNAWLPFKQVVKWVEEWMVTINELQQGILWEIYH